MDPLVRAMLIYIILLAVALCLVFIGSGDPKKPEGTCKSSSPSRSL